ncbi:hypothetical protein WR25_14739 [Diploscapter pachys]|uniref:Tyrosine-protein phosphatase domain-containing protein n=1 Tax=Diploscapter pachys TaxID=2018661 RepID=A0A2A2JN32_9BILA|nr:hypothetical protein WR25_14739 [Diploscapter pachys]
MDDEKKIRMKDKSKVGGKKKTRTRTKGRTITVENMINKENENGIRLYWDPANSENPNRFDLRSFYPRGTDPLPRPAVQKHNFRIFTEEIVRANINKLIEQFNKNVQTYKTHNKQVAYEANKNKNRYSDIPCLDATRVVLDDKVPRGDYIHANYVNGLDSEIVLTQMCVCVCV